jgi:hypothetical protein
MTSKPGIEAWMRSIEGKPVPGLFPPPVSSRTSNDPEFLALSQELHAHLDDLTDRVIRDAINDDVSEAAEATPKALTVGGDDG